MKLIRRVRINRKLLVAAPILYILFLTILFASNADEWNWIRVRQECGFLIMIFLPVPLFFAVLRFPAMIYSKILAGISIFWMASFVLMMPLMVALDYFDLFPVIKSSLLLNLAFCACFVFMLICIAKSVAEAVTWVGELREKKKAEDAGEGIERMKKGLITFIRPRLVFAWMIFGILLMLNSMDMQGHVTGAEDIAGGIILGGAFLLTAVYILWSIWDYHRYIKGLEHSGALDQAVLEYYSGHVYCEGRVVLGIKYIFVEGEARIYEYENFTKYYYKWGVSGRVHYWDLYAVKKDGTEIQLIELPYGRTKKNYYEHVYPMINEIRIKSKNVLIEGPGEFRK